MKLIIDKEKIKIINYISQDNIHTILNKHKYINNLFNLQHLMKKLIARKNH